MGQFLVFLIFPVFVLPYFEERFEVRLPNQLPAMSGKVLFYRYGPAIEHIVEEFRRTRSPFVIFEDDLEVARALRDRALPVVFGRLNDDPTRFERVRQARAIVCNAGDHGNAECTLAVREHGYTGSIATGDSNFISWMVTKGVVMTILGVVLWVLALWTTNMSELYCNALYLGPAANAAGFRLHRGKIVIVVGIRGWKRLDGS